MLGGLPRDVARTVENDMPRSDCSRTQFLDWLQSQARALKDCLENIYASQDLYAGRACLSAVFLLMSRMALGCELARVRQYWKKAFTFHARPA